MEKTLKKAGKASTDKDQVLPKGEPLVCHSGLGVPAGLGQELELICLAPDLPGEPQNQAPSSADRLSAALRIGFQDLVLHGQLP